MIEQINNISQIWWGWIGSIVLQASVLIVLIGVIDLLIRRWVWPQVRYALWLLVLVKLVLPPSLSLPTSLTGQFQLWANETAGITRQAEVSLAAGITDLPVVPEPGVIVAPQATAESPPRLAVEDSSRATLQPMENPPTPLQKMPLVSAAAPAAVVWQAYAMVVWLFGMWVLAGWLIVRLGLLRKGIKHCRRGAAEELPQWFSQLLGETARQLKLRRLPEVVLSRKVASPAVFGIFRPILLIPVANIGKLSPQEAQHVLLHELAHIKRSDLAVNGFYMLLQIVYWFNPLLWLVGRHLRYLRELCCDATVALVLRENTDKYRQTLLATARQLLAQPSEPGMGLLGLFENSSRLIIRLKWLEKKTWRHRRLRIATVCVMIAVMAACILPMAQAQKETAVDTLTSEQPEPTKQNKFTATLDNGVTVELVGLGTAPWETEQQWWQPDGTEIDKPQFKARPNEWRQKDPNGLQFKCTTLFRFSDHLNKKISVPEGEFSNKFLFRGSGSGIADDGTYIMNIVYHPREDVPNKADISLALGVGPFKKATTSERLSKKQHQIYLLEGNLVVIRHPIRIDSNIGTLTVDLTCPAKDYDFRVLAELKDGSTEQWYGGSIGKEVKFFHATPKRENIKIEDIEELIIEYRLYQWMTFKNVSLQPGRKTDVAIELGEDLASVKPTKIRSPLSVGPAATIEIPRQDQPVTGVTQVAATMPTVPLPEFTKTLDNGVTVELVGVARVTEQGLRWWRMDGKPMAPIEGVVEADLDFGGAPILLFRTKPASVCIEYVRYRRPNDNWLLDMSGQDGDVFWYRPEADIFFAVMNKDFRFAHLGMHIDRLETVHTIRLDESDIGKQIEVGKYGLEKIRDLKRRGPDAFGFTLDHSIDWNTYRLGAIDKKGTRHQDRDYSPDFANFHFPIEQLDSLVIEKKFPAEVEFRNVCLQPGRKTDVAIELGEDLALAEPAATIVDAETMPTPGAVLSPVAPTPAGAPAKEADSLETPFQPSYGQPGRHWKMDLALDELKQLHQEKLQLQKFIRDWQANTQNIGKFDLNQERTQDEWDYLYKVYMNDPNFRRDAVRSLSDQVAKLTSKRDSLLKTTTADNPEVKTIDDEIYSLQEQLNRKKQEIVREGIEQKRKDTEDVEQRHIQKLEALMQQYEETEVRLMDMDGKIIAIRRTQNEIDSLNRHLEEYESLISTHKVNLKSPDLVPVRIASEGSIGKDRATGFLFCKMPGTADDSGRGPTPRKDVIAMQQAGHVTILQSDSFLQSLLQRADVRNTKWWQNIKDDPEALMKSLKVSFSATAVRDTEYITLTMIAKDPQEAKIIVDAALKEFVSQIREQATADIYETLNTLTLQRDEIEAQVKRLERELEKMAMEM